MITVNLTLMVEAFFFLLFFAVTRRIVWQPLMQLMEQRRETFESRRAAAAQKEADAQQLSESYRNKLERTTQQAIQKKNNAVYAAHQARRALITGLKARADLEVLEYRTLLQNELEKHRKAFPEILPGLIEVMDYQIEKGGRLL
ncbi:MAG: ATP synthase subunit b precursor [Candidatus Hydrogenedentes bacterium ADurb.Bin101]|nr:MAG: ATP synthase subunit b precursor [Candidatus Hydrogenedentes bacterium ADurb.Bin101]HOH28134.1 hypothetical protein [Candidatus Hydrogenedentota bacterium]